MRRLIAIGVAVACIAVAGCGSSSGSVAQVKSDLQGLLIDKNPDYQVSFCTHRSGNSYECQVYGLDNKPVYLDVTDDGSSIYEEGLGPNS